MAYVDQFDHLVRLEDRGRAVRFTRTVAVFDDGLVVCAVSVYGVKTGGLMAGLRRGTRSVAGAVPGRGDEQIRASAQAIGASTTFAETWPKARVIPLPVIDSVVLTRPRQVSELSIYEVTNRPGSTAASTLLGDLSAGQVRTVLEPLLGNRLHIEVAD